MAVPSGVGSSVGVSPEVTPGTYVAPTRFSMVDKIDIKKVKNIAQGNGLGAGRLMALGSRRVPTTKSAKGTVSMELVNRAMGQWIQSLMGTTITPVVQGATAGYLQTHGKDAVDKGTEVCVNCHLESGCLRCHVRHLHIGVAPEIIQKLEKFGVTGETSTGSSSSSGSTGGSQ